MYGQYEQAEGGQQRRMLLRNIAMAELLFSTGIRISELCRLKKNDVSLKGGYISIHGRSARERKIVLSRKVLDVLAHYDAAAGCTRKYFFINRLGEQCSEQIAQRFLKKYAGDASIRLHITSKMLRNTFAVALLEEGMDVCSLQEVLGHSDVSRTVQYRKSIPKEKLDISEITPRNKLNI